MPVFISYSHSDSAFVNMLGAHLVKKNAHVWIDTWELNIGDSIIGKVQDAIQDASALLIILSKASVQSEWCKKELSAALMRELDERRVMVLPVLLEQCEIPIFLRDKKFADFRTDFDVGLTHLVDSLARVTNADQGRIEMGGAISDWSVDWGDYDGQFMMHFTIVETSADMPFTILTEVIQQCNKVVTRRYASYVKAGLDWMGRQVLSEALVELAETKDIRVVLDSQLPQIKKARLVDSASGAAYDVTIRCRRLGEDNGKDQLVNISEYLKRIRDFMRNTNRKLTAEEQVRLQALMRR